MAPFFCPTSHRSSPLPGTWSTELRRLWGNEGVAVTEESAGLWNTGSDGKPMRNAMTPGSPVVPYFDVKLWIDGSLGPDEDPPLRAKLASRSICKKLRKLVDALHSPNLLSRLPVHGS
ncbi:hypothetical protein DFP72DRAFT_1039443 [Ephemerocybe angulata]|uniref:Uncharacterized protein n=1 Tax=Ephemerocybe angulata TaxID=980116 RepID=A0A8H6IIP9_9AGAR|nr:hypothetical protein DFP72DRAFT_1039443 [Tulosesus angulatus]